MSEPERRYIPALRFRALTPLYDRVLASTLKERKFKTLLVEQARIRPGHRVLDVGCGTGTLSILLKQTVPEAAVVGLDADPQALAIARRKADAAGVAIEFHRALAWEGPFGPGAFDRIVSSLVFHHLRAEDKLRTLNALLGWLEPDGELHIADWGRAQNALMRLAFLGVQLLDGFETTSDNVRRGLVPFLEASGFTSARETRREMTVFGTLSLDRASATGAAR